jgi:hypothetical protein
VPKEMIFSLRVVRTWFGSKGSISFAVSAIFLIHLSDFMGNFFS